MYLYGLTVPYSQVSIFLTKARHFRNSDPYLDLYMLDSPYRRMQAWLEVLPWVLLLISS